MENQLYYMCKYLCSLPFLLLSEFRIESHLQTQKDCGKTVERHPKTILKYEKAFDPTVLIIGTTRSMSRRKKRIWSNTYLKKFYRLWAPKLCVLYKGKFFKVSLYSVFCTCLCVLAIKTFYICLWCLRNFLLYKKKHDRTPWDK